MHRVSPSQITTARQCLRRWWWQSVKGFKSPPTASTIFGGNVHAALEHRILHGSWPAGLDSEVLSRAQPAFDALSKHVPDLKGADVEGEWKIDAGDYKLPASGRYDLFLPLDNLVVDWKTTSDLKWAKTECDQLEDPQVLLYIDALQREGKVKLPARFAHVYTVTRGRPVAQYREVTISADDLSLGRKAINVTLEQMDEHSKATDFEKVPANLLACKDFGGCPHWGRCFGKENEKEQNMSDKQILDAFAARRAQKGMINPPESQPAAKVDWSASAQMDEQRPAGRSVTQAVEALQAQPFRVLLLGCAPMVGASDYVLFDQWVLPFVAQAQERLKVPYWGLADFGKGKAAIVAAVAEAVGRGDTPPRLIVDRRSALGDACAEILLSHYDLVISKLG